MKPNPEVINLRIQEGNETKIKIIKLINKKKYVNAIDLLREWSYHAQRWSQEELIEFYWPQLAYVYWKTNNFYKAKQHLNKMLEKNSENGMALLMFANIDLIEDNITKAIYRYTELLKNRKYQKKSKAILNFISKQDTVVEMFLKKKPEFFYCHPPHLLPPKISQFKRWCEFNNFKFLDKKIFNFKLILILTLVALLVILGGNIIYNIWFLKSPPNAIENEISLGTQWGQLYERMEEALHNRDMNTVIITYNQTLQKGVPSKLKEYFNYLHHFVVTPETESLPITKSFTHLRNDQNLYKETFVRLQGKISFQKKTGQYIYLPLRPINEKIVINFTSSIKLESERYEIIARFKKTVGTIVYLQGISIRTIIN